MGIELAKAFIRIRGDASQLAADMRRGESGAVDAVQSMANKIKGALLAVGGALVGKKAVGLAAEFESTQIAFESFLGSAEKAKAEIESLTNFAARTPFSLRGINQAAGAFMRAGTTGKDLTDILTALGNAAAAGQTDFGIVAAVFNQIRGAGKLLTQDFRQLSTRGVITAQDLSAFLKIPVEEVFQRMSKGLITFQDVKDTFMSMSKEGGRAFDFMARQSGTFNGVMSNLGDNIDILLRDIGVVILRGLKPLMQAVSGVIGIAKDGFRAILAAFDRANAATQGWLGSVLKTVAAFISLATAMAAVRRIVASKWIQMAITQFVALVRSIRLVRASLLGLVAGTLFWLFTSQKAQEAIKRNAHKLAEAWERVKLAMTNIGKAILRMLAPIAKWMGTTFDSLSDVGAGLVDVFADVALVLAKIFQGITQNFSQAMRVLGLAAKLAAKTILIVFVNMFMELIKVAIPVLVELGKTLADAVVSGLLPGGKSFDDALKKGIPKIVNALGKVDFDKIFDLSSLDTDFKQLAKEWAKLVGGLKDPTKKDVDETAKAIKKAAGGDAQPAAKPQAMRVGFRELHTNIQDMLLKPKEEVAKKNLAANAAAAGHLAGVRSDLQNLLTKMQDAGLASP